MSTRVWLLTGLALLFVAVPAFAGDLNSVTLRGNIERAAWSEDATGTRGDHEIWLWNYSAVTPQLVRVRCLGSAATSCLSPDIMGCAQNGLDLARLSGTVVRATRRCVNGDTNRQAGNCLTVRGVLYTGTIVVPSADFIRVERRALCTPK